jgi:predicted nucleic acid-binding protein
MRELRKRTGKTTVDESLMAFVVDAAIQMRTEEGVVPSLWWFEVRNILIVNERRRRITESGTASFLLNLSLLRLRVDRSPEENAVLRLARAHRLSVYDAAYLELA